MAHLLSTNLLIGIVAFRRAHVHVISAIVIAAIVAPSVKGCAQQLKTLPSFRITGSVLSSEARMVRNGLIVGVAVATVLLPLYWSRMLPESNGHISSGGSVWGDGPIHMHIAL